MVRTGAGAAMDDQSGHPHCHHSSPRTGTCHAAVRALLHPTAHPDFLNLTGCPKNSRPRGKGALSLGIDAETSPEQPAWSSVHDQLLQFKSALWWGHGMLSLLRCRLCDPGT